MKMTDVEVEARVKRRMLTCAFCIWSRKKDCTQIDKSIDTTTDAGMDIATEAIELKCAWNLEAPVSCWSVEECGCWKE